MSASSLRFTVFALLVLTCATGPAPRISGCANSAGRASRVAGSGAAGKVVPRAVASRSARPTVRLMPVRLPHLVPGGKAAAEPAEAAGRQLGAKLEEIERHAGARVWARVEQEARKLLLTRGLPVEVTSALRGLQEPAGRLQAAQELQRLIAEPWKSAPDADAVLRSIRRLEAGGNKQAADSLRQYLACRARLEGHQQLARRLAPEGAAKADAAALLRDLKAAAPPTAHSPPPAGEASPLGTLLPEGPALSFRPEVRESLNADLPALKELSAAEKEARARVLRALEGNARLDSHRARVFLHGLRSTSGEGKLPTQPRPVAGTQTAEFAPAELSSLLGRSLSPAETMLARHLRQKKTAAEVADILRRLDAPGK